MTVSHDFTDAEAALIERAKMHGEGCLAVSRYWNAQTVARAVARLIDMGIFEERPAKIGRPIWRHDDRLGEISLVLTPEGRGLAQSLPPAWQTAADPFALDR